jgi:uncharacterized protein (TIGR03083 family)
MMTAPPQGTGVTVAEPVVAVLTGQWRALEELLGGLAEDEWSAATCLPGWQVRDIVAHLIGTEMTLAGAEAPPCGVDVRALPHVRNDIAATNERWVLSLRAESGAAVLEKFGAVTRGRAEALAAMTPAEFAAPSWTPVGEGTYREFMQFRVFDCWLHEQDIRDAVGRPGHETGPCADAAVARIGGALGYVVGKRAGAPAGSAVTFQLTGPIRRTIFVQVDGRARVVDCLDRTATTTLTMSSNAFVRLGAGRVGPSEPPVEIDGDAELGRRVLESLAITP